MKAQIFSNQKRLLVLFVVSCCVLIATYYNRTLKRWMDVVDIFPETRVLSPLTIAEEVAILNAEQERMVLYDIPIIDPAEAATATENWPLFSSQKYGYQFKYPPGTNIEDTSMDGDESPDVRLENLLNMGISDPEFEAGIFTNYRYLERSRVVKEDWKLPLEEFARLHWDIALNDPPFYFKRFKFVGEELEQTVIGGSTAYYYHSNVPRGDVDVIEGKLSRPMPSPEQQITHLFMEDSKGQKYMLIIPTLNKNTWYALSTWQFK